MAVDEFGNEIITSSEPSEAQKRITQLSDKVRVASEERDAEKAARESLEAKVVEAERKAAFSDGFSDILSENPAAKDFKADIQAKVMSGYTVEDAAFAVLGKAGKLGPQVAPTPSASEVAGGSATVTAPQNGDKPISDMSQSERRAKLESEIAWN